MDKNSVAKNKVKISNKWLAWGVVLLILIAAVSWYFSRYYGQQEERTVVIKAGDTILGRVTVADLLKLSAVEKRMVVTANCSGACGSENNDAPIEHLYTGVSLLEVMNSIDPTMVQKYTKVITRGVDYYSQVMEMPEVQQPDNVYIVYRDNGQPLKTKTGRDGSLMLVVCSDQSGQRFTNWLVSLELQ